MLLACCCLLLAFSNVSLKRVECPSAMDSSLACSRLRRLKVRLVGLLKASPPSPPWPSNRSCGARVCFGASVAQGKKQS